MLTKKKNNMIPAEDFISESGSFEEAVQDLEFRCETVSEVVKEKVFPLKKALEVYNVTLGQYFGYLMLRNDSKITLENDVVLSIFATVLNAMDFSDPNLDSKTEKVISDLRQLSAV